MPLHDWTRVEDGIFHDFHFEMIHAVKKSLNRGVLPRVTRQGMCAREEGVPKADHVADPTHS